jgi:hypothetical protein
MQIGSNLHSVDSHLSEALIKCGKKVRGDPMSSGRRRTYKSHPSKERSDEKEDNPCPALHVMFLKFKHSGIWRIFEVNILGYCRNCLKSNLWASRPQTLMLLSFFTQPPCEINQTLEKAMIINSEIATDVLKTQRMFDAALTTVSGMLAGIHSRLR